jgi:hypothetical protein
LGFLLFGLTSLGGSLINLSAATFSSFYGTSRQVNVDASGQNIPGDAANEPSLCIDPTNPNRIAVGWRQFDSTNSDFRQSGVAYSTNGGLNWTFPGVLEPGTFRSDPVLASDANGVFYYLGISNENTFAEDLFRSTDGGKTWQRVGGALGGDKEWMVIDTTTGPGRGNIYQVWSPYYNVYTNATYPSGDPNRIFSRSINGGTNWIPAVSLPNTPVFGTLDIGPNGELYSFAPYAYSYQPFVLNRSTNAQNPLVTPTIDQTSTLDFGGQLTSGYINPGGLLGQAWVAVDRSTNQTRGNVYALCSIGSANNLVDVMFARSTNRGATWSTPVRINDDPDYTNSWHWFGTVAVAPNGRVDVCWYDTRSNSNKTGISDINAAVTNNNFSELYYCYSLDGGLSWAPNRPISPRFNHTLGYPQQEKIGDYMGMVSLNECACIAYSATFNGEEDIYFVRAELPITATVTAIGGTARISWNSVIGGSYCVQVKTDASQPWSSGSNVACVVSTGSTASVDDLLAASGAPRYYRVVRQP